MPKHLLTFLCFFLLLKGAAAQNYVNEDTTRRLRVAAAVALLQQIPNEASSIYNGREHISYNPLFIGHGYFSTNNWQKATIVYDGGTYSDVPALLDLVKDELVILHHNGNVAVQLVKEKVNRFSISDQNFVHVRADSTRNLRPGFYHVLHDGNTQVLAQRSKIIEPRTVSMTIETHFVPRNQFFIINKGKLYPVRSAGALFNALADRRRAVQQYVRKNKLKFREDPDNTILKAVAFYDTPAN